MVRVVQLRDAACWDSAYGLRMTFHILKRFYISLIGRCDKDFYFHFFFFFVNTTGSNLLKILEWCFIFQNSCIIALYLPFRILLRVILIVLTFKR